MGGKSEGMLIFEDSYDESYPPHPTPCHQHCYRVSTSLLAATLKRGRRERRQSSVLPVCYQFATSVLPVCYQCATSVSVLPVCYQCATNVLPVC